MIPIIVINNDKGIAKVLVILLSLYGNNRYMRRNDVIILSCNENNGGDSMRTAKFNKT